jgi:surface protein
MRRRAKYINEGSDRPQQYVFRIPSDNYTVTLNKRTSVNGNQFNYTVDWGDGTSDTYTNNAAQTHVYAVAGDYTVNIFGYWVGGFQGGNGNDVLLDILDWGSFAYPTLPEFSECNLLTTVTADSSGLNTTGIGSNSEPRQALSFVNCINLTFIDVVNWDFSLCDTAPTFSGCNISIALDVSNWNITNLITSISSLFRNNNNLPSITGLENWDVSQVTSFSQTFLGCRSLTSLNVDGWDVSSGTSFSSMFDGCESLTGFTNDLSLWVNTNISNCSRMFNDCIGLTTMPTPNLKPAQADYMFGDLDSVSVLDVRNIDYSEVTNLDNHFERCDNATSLLGWDGSTVVKHPTTI